MKSKIILFASVLTIFCCAFNGSIFAAPSAVYAQLSSSNAQYSSSSSLVNFEHVNGIHGIDYLSNTHLRIKNAGTYFIKASGQLGIDPVAPQGFVELWAVRNGEEIPYSRVRQSIPKRQFSIMVVSEIVVQLDKDDVINIAFSSDNPKIGLVPIEASSIPSISCSIFEIR